MLSSVWLDPHGWRLFFLWLFSLFPGHGLPFLPPVASLLCLAFACQFFVLINLAVPFCISFPHPFLGFSAGLPSLRLVSQSDFGTLLVAILSSCQPSLIIQQACTTSDPMSLYSLHCAQCLDSSVLYCMLQTPGTCVVISIFRRIYLCGTLGKWPHFAAVQNDWSVFCIR